MKAKLNIIELSQDDLVELLSSSLYDSYWASANYDSIEYKQLPNAEENDCLEDKCAKLLLAGKTIEIADRESFNDYYGSLPHKWDEEEKTMNYTISLKDIKRGINKCFKTNPKAVINLIEQEEDFYDADSILQTIVFGKAIYG